MEDIQMEEGYNDATNHQATRNSSDITQSIYNKDYTQLMHILHDEYQSPTEFNLTFLHSLAIEAIQSQDLETLECLVMSQPSLVMRVRKEDQEKRLIHYAAEMGNVELMKWVVNKGSPLSVTDKTGYSAMHYAIEGHFLEAVAFLLKEGISVNRARSRDGYLAIHLAVMKGHLEMVKLLRNRGHADLNALTKPPSGISQDNTENRPIHIAAQLEDYLMLDYLCVAGADINGQNSKGDTALNIVVRKDNEDLVNYLLNHGASTEIFNNTGFTVLHDAALSNTPRVMQILLEHGCNVDTLSYKESPQESDKAALGCTALHYAATHGHTVIAKMLLDKGAKVDIRAVSTLRTPCIMATDGAHYDILHALLQAGANVNIPDVQNSTALHVVQNISRNKQAPSAIDITQLLIEYGADLNYPDSHGFTPLDKCVGQLMRQNYNKHLLSLLVTSGARLEQSSKRSTQHRSPNSSLCWLAWKKQLKSAQFLIEAGWSLTTESWITFTAPNKQLTEFLDSVQRMLRHPPMLQHSCRMAIRKHLMAESDNREILTKVSRLDLPNRLKSYINLEVESEVMLSDSQWRNDEFIAIIGPV
ncbi:unnamed protein product [Owenia fusiformis]|uniref:Uncharacterized protein n=1 Tax=Owenia fusiformis TaxID=6347 RepID=A0A8J1XUF0_OWEFU|nr:unnamed protein product [Owenia fusiformis]